MADLPTETMPTQAVNEPTFNETKQDYEEFTGGCEIQTLNKTVKGQKLKEVLRNKIGDILEQAIKDQKPLLTKIKKWDRQFRGVKARKATKDITSANAAIPITRSLIENVVVRIFDTIWGQKKVFIVEPKTEEFKDIYREVEDALDWWQRDIVKFRKKLISPFLQSCKFGTGLIYMPYVRKKRTQYRYANQEEQLNPDIKKYKHGKNLVIKEPVTVYEGPDVVPLDRIDFIISSDATTIEDAFLSGYRFFLHGDAFLARTKAPKGTKPLYKLDADQTAAIMMGDEYPEEKKSRIEASNKGYDDHLNKKIELWQLWLRYDVDGDGEADDIVVIFHKDTRTICRAYYNDTFYGYRPIQAFVGRPVEYQFDGDGMCGILEKLQEEIDSLHNMRLDRLAQINGPIYIERAGAIQGNQKLYPGARLKADEIEGAIKELTHHGIYPGTFTEESMLYNYAQQGVGVTSNTMGQSTSERPVARETLALLQETNKSFKYLIDNIRAEIEESGVRAIEQMAQYTPVYKYSVRNDSGSWEEKTIEFPLGYIRDGVKIKLSASSELLNTEVRRQVDMTIYHLLSDYYTKVTGMAQMVANPQVPPEFKQFLMQVARISRGLMENILRDFGQVNEEELAVDIPQELAMAKPPQPPQPPPGQAGLLPGQPPQGPPNG